MYLVLIFVSTLFVRFTFFLLILRLSCRRGVCVCQVKIGECKEGSRDWLEFTAGATQKMWTRESKTPLTKMLETHLLLQHWREKSPNSHFYKHHHIWGRSGNNIMYICIRRCVILTNTHARARTCKDTYACSQERAKPCKSPDVQDDTGEMRKGGTGRRSGVPGRREGEGVWQRRGECGGEGWVFTTV